MKNILFISWDGPQTTYMEGLFLPIFRQIQQQSDYRFHVIQFTWGTADRTALTAQAAAEADIPYTARRILRKPHPLVGSMATVFAALPFLQSYIRRHDITIVMPRSTMPAAMVNRLRRNGFEVVFDADGLPLEERVDFQGLRSDALSYRLLKREETRLLQSADAILTRSNKAIAVHEERTGVDPMRFFRVLNGRDETFFVLRAQKRLEIRNAIGAAPEATVFVYCGSLGHQYGWDEMMAVFTRFRSTHPDAMFLILTGNPEFAAARLPEAVAASCVVRTVPFREVPDWLAAADVAFAIRQPKPSMQGVSPTKLGEYLLMELPTIASKGIGDTEDMLAPTRHSFLFDHDNPNAVSDALRFIEGLDKGPKPDLREAGLRFFSLAKAAESYITALEHRS